MEEDSTMWQRSLWATSPGRDKRNEAWELYHENSKIGRFEYFPSQEEIVQRMKTNSQTLSYSRYPKINLPKELDTVDVDHSNFIEIVAKRRTPKEMAPVSLSLEQISTILFCSYGVSKSDNPNTRPLRTAPSGGALYPLDIFFISSPGNELIEGLYHYNPLEHNLSFLEKGDLRQNVSARMVYEDIPLTASLTIFIVAQFERTVFKYRNRGYRFTLIEAGHVAQNMNLACTILDLKIKNIGGYFDREIDEFLGLDGIQQSTIYMSAIGG